MHATALIAEDEPLLAASLKAELARAWPGLEVVACVGDGAAALDSALRLRPDVLFLDIRMPAMSGLEAAQALSEDWPDAATLPLMVFVTAYDEYALQAFEHAAIDYVRKPVAAARLAQTCGRLQALLARRAAPPAEGADPRESRLEATLAELRGLLAAPGLGAGPASSGPNPGPAYAASVARLSVIQAAAGSAIHLVPIGDVLYFESADKYVRVVTLECEHLIRTSLRELLPQLDPQRFWQVHRGTVVRADAIATALRDDSGKLTLRLRGHADTLIASRLYAHRFKAM